jgi:hypothetical protein
LPVGVRPIVFAIQTLRGTFRQKRLDEVREVHGHDGAIR